MMLNVYITIYREKHPDLILIGVPGPMPAALLIVRCRFLIIAPRPMPAAPGSYLIVVPRSLPAALLIVRCRYLIVAPGRCPRSSLV
jgi:hypothetical protein